LSRATPLTFLKLLSSFLEQILTHKSADAHMATQLWFS
jgi:hypothetical protein